MATKLKLELEYDGAAFSGWQFQTGLTTVQGELEKALQILVSSLAKKLGVDAESSINTTASGRTDAGVHAKAQAVSFIWPENLPCDVGNIKHALNGITIPELVVRSAVIVEDTFDARFTPHVKCYQYSMLLRDEREGLYRGRAWRIGSGIDLPSMISAAKLIRGQHDFSSFRAQDCSATTTVRTIVGSELVRLDDLNLVYAVYGKGFLKQMIRIIVGTLVEVGKGKITVNEFKSILEGRDRSRAGMTAPAHGLCMEWVRY